MLGNPKWFKRRKYSGWGLTPATWQGWVYIGGLACSIFAVWALAVWAGLQASYQVGIMLSVLAIFVIDSLDIAIKMDKDERETTHEALAERNVAWVMVTVLVVGIVYQAILSTLQGDLYVDPFMVTTLLGGVLAKGMTNCYLIDK